MSPGGPPRPAKGPDNLELFGWRRAAQQTKPTILTVSQLNGLARDLLEERFTRVTVSGEISNYKRHASGHHYFTLKDSNAQLPAALFRREAARVGFPLRIGLEVLATGRVTVYAKTGRYQLIVEQLEPRGAGALQAAFEALKARLQEEGLFAAERKRPLPALPRRVAVATSASGAVLRDIVQVAGRRFPGAAIVLVPCDVQGAESAASIAAAIRRAGQHAERLGLDALIVGRGGGSLEDLWGFNEESVARAIAESPLVVVSAVGHETDFTIADFVADVRAPTPSAAAELLFPVRSELVARLGRSVDRCARANRRLIEVERHRLAARRLRLGDGATATREARQGIGESLQRLVTAMRREVGTAQRGLHERERRLHALHPQVRLRELRGRIQLAGHTLRQWPAPQLATLRRRVDLAPRMGDLLARNLAAQRARLGRSAARLDALSPLRVLQRGYAIATTGARGEVIRDAAQVRRGDAVDLRLAKGRLCATVTGSYDDE